MFIVLIDKQFLYGMVGPFLLGLTFVNISHSLFQPARKSFFFGRRINRCKVRNVTKNYFSATKFLIKQPDDG